MIYLFTALYTEAEIFIKRFHLEKNLKNIRFQEFYQENAGIRLTITGVGEIAAAAAVSSVCTASQPQEGDILLNIGTCAHLAGKDGVFVCNKITEQASGKTFYPDLLYRHDLQEEAVVTGMLPCNRKLVEISFGSECTMSDKQSCNGKGHPVSEGLSCNSEEHSATFMFSGNVDRGHEKSPVESISGTLYDMEAAAIYHAGSYFFGPHQMMFLKVVSDAGIAKEVSKEAVERCMEMNQTLLFDFIGEISAIIHKNQEKENNFQQEKTQMEILCRDLHCSKVMGDSLRQHIHYWELTGMDYISAIQDMYREGLLPGRDKREGKLCFEELKRRLF